MNYEELQQGYFECKIKCTYAEIYVRWKNDTYALAFSLQKKDFNGVLGVGERGRMPVGTNLVPISLTEDAIRAIAKKVLSPEEYAEKVGTALATDKLTDMNAQTFFQSELNFVKTDNSNFDASTNTVVNKPTVIPSNKEVDDLENEAVNDPLSRIDDDFEVYVNYKAIECTQLSDDEVEVEDEEEVEEPKQRRDYSKLIWAALAAAATLFR